MKTIYALFLLTNLIAGSILKSTLFRDQRTMKDMTNLVAWNASNKLSRKTPNKKYRDSQFVDTLAEEFHQIENNEISFGGYSFRVLGIQPQKQVRSSGLYGVIVDFEFSDNLHTSVYNLQLETKYLHFNRCVDFSPTKAVLLPHMLAQSEEQYLEALAEMSKDQLKQLMFRIGQSKLSVDEILNGESKTKKLRNICRTSVIENDKIVCSASIVGVVNRILVGDSFPIYSKYVHLPTNKW